MKVYIQVNVHININNVRYPIWSRSSMASIQYHSLCQWGPWHVWTIGTPIHGLKPCKLIFKDSLGIQPYWLKGGYLFNETVFSSGKSRTVLLKDSVATSCKAVLFTAELRRIKKIFLSYQAQSHWWRAYFDCGQANGPKKNSWFPCWFARRKSRYLRWRHEGHQLQLPESFQQVMIFPVIGLVGQGWSSIRGVVKCLVLLSIAPGLSIYVPKSVPKTHCLMTKVYKKQW